MAAYEAYSAVFFNHFIINGLQKSLFCMPKQALLQGKTGSFLCTKQALLKISNHTLGFLIIAEHSMLRLHMMDICLSACAYQQAC